MRTEKEVREELEGCKEHYDNLFNGDFPLNKLSAHILNSYIKALEWVLEMDEDE